MKRFHILIATTLGIGYIKKGGGTVAAIFCCIAWYFAGNTNVYWQSALTLLVCLIGTWSSNYVDADWGKDSSKVVVDEVAGMMITLLFIPVELKYILSGLAFFRFFDIAKPLFVRKLEQLPKGYGVMADDILAGIYANIVLQLIVHYNLF